MLSTPSVCITSNQQELSVIKSHLSLKTLSQVQVQDIMEESGDRIQDLNLAIPDHSTSEFIKLYRNVIVGLLERDDLTRSRWTNFYQ